MTTTYVCGHVGCKHAAEIMESSIAHELDAHGSVRGPMKQRRAVWRLMEANAERTWTADQIAEVLGFSTSRARDILNDLTSGEYIEQLPGRPHTWRWRP